MKTAIYHPLTQRTAVAFAARQIEKKAATIGQYFRARIFQVMTTIERAILAEVTLAFHQWYGTRGWTYADMVSTGRRDRLEQGIAEAIASGYRELAQMAGQTLNSGKAWGAVGTLYMADVITPPTITPKAALTADRIRISGTRAQRLQDELQHQADNLRRALMRTLERSMLDGEMVGEALARIEAVFGPETTRKTTRMTERFREADSTPTTGTTMADDTSPVSGVIDPEAWDQAVGDLRDAMGWETRSPGYVTPDGGAAYDAERVLMTEYTRAVRDGQIEAAMPNGDAIPDFVWVAVIDDRDCEDCFARADMTMTEIADKFGDDSAPPLHPNCRCALIPSLPDWNPLAGDWADPSNPDGGRSVTDPATGETTTPGVDSLDDWIARLDQ